ncbi:MAG: endonuclease III [Candidatus Korarchaeum sp.]|nr:endonuclease III [Candidatus Korarchaeum sp.]MDW8036273.1 endonuclease III [Candidatus Korarchaeum sp.]
MRKGDEILRRLSQEFNPRDEEYASLLSFREGNLFEVLVTTVISQNTNDRNTMKVLRRMREKFGTVTPERILETRTEELENIIRPAGLYRQKAKYLKEIVKELSGGALKDILEKDLEEARRRLISIPGIGPKTADVLLSVVSKGSIAVDRHIARVSLRLGITDRKDYESIRRALMELFDEKDYLKAHLLLIKLGRVYCRPRNPKCQECPLRDICVFSHSLEPRDANKIH